MTILVEQLDKSFSDSIILQRLDLQVERGEIVGIIGSNASGKSTLIQLLSGILRPDHGSITINGVNIVDRPTLAKRAITAVYQETLFNQMVRPISALLSYGRFYRPRLSVTEVRNLLLELGIDEEDLKKPLFKLSGGSKKKVEFAKCLLCDTPIYLFDEPFTGFDTASRETGHSTLEHLRAQGKAILLCDHDKRAINLSDRVLELEEGRLRPILIEEVRAKMQVEAEVKGWRKELKEVLERLPEVAEIAVRKAPMSADEIAAILQKAGIDSSGKQVQVIYADDEKNELAKLLAMSGGAAQKIQTSDEVASHVILTITLTEKSENLKDLTWLNHALLAQELEVLRLEMIGV